jgi:hypothetical protein
MELVFNPSRLTGVTTIRPIVAGVLQMILELTLAVLQVRMSQLRRIR